jgi:predicted homoserine dehydrogenase-like protein
MILVDSALSERAAQDRPIRVGVLGAGFMARGLANRIVNGPPGMSLVAVYGRRIDRACDVYNYCGLTEVVEAGSQSAMDAAIRQRRPVVSDDAFLLARSEQIDVLVDTPGSVEFGAR